MIAQDNFKDPTLWALITANIASLILALTLQWSLFEMVWIYLSQNIAIGFTNYFRLRSLEKKSAPNKTNKNLKTSVFFAIHYGFFHVGYILFLTILGTSGIKDTAFTNISFFTVLILSFIGTHLFSFKQNNKKEFKTDPAPVSILLFYPYIRTIPMHITIIAAFFIESTAGLILFMSLKTLGDGAMHIIEHKIFRNK